LANEKEPSSHFRKSSLLLDLLDILESVLDVVSFSILLHEKDYSSGSAPPQDNTAYKTSGRKDSTSTPLRVVIESTPPPPAPTEKQKAKEENEERRKDDAEKREGRKFIAEVIIACVTSLLLIVNVWLVCTARHANKIAGDALYISHRPWVGLDGGIQFTGKPEIQLPNRFIKLSFRYFLKDYGTTPAKESSSESLFISKDDITKPELPMQVACSNADGKFSGSIVIFPNASIKTDAKPGVNFGPEIQGISRMWIAICVSYGDSAGIHHTKIWIRTEPDTRIPAEAVPGFTFRYYPVFEPQVFDEEAD
jgi:hypothetical protein